MESHVSLGEDTSSWLPTCYGKVEGLGFTGSILGILIFFGMGFLIFMIKGSIFFLGLCGLSLGALEVVD